MNEWSQKLTAPPVLVHLPYWGAAFKTTILLGPLAQVDFEVRVGARAARSGARPSQDRPVVGRTHRMASRRQASEPATNPGSRKPEAAVSIADCRRPGCHSSKVFQRRCTRPSSIFFRLRCCLVACFGRRNSEERINNSTPMEQRVTSVAVWNLMTRLSARPPKTETFSWNVFVASWF